MQRLRAVPDSIAPNDGIFPHSDASCSNSSKIVSDSAIKTTALAELRRADADAAAVAQFVDFVEKFTTSKRILRAVFSVIWIRRDKCTLNVS